MGTWFGHLQSTSTFNQGCAPTVDSAVQCLCGRACVRVCHQHLHWQAGCSAYRLPVWRQGRASCLLAQPPMQAVRDLTAQLAEAEKQLAAWRGKASATCSQLGVADAVGLFGSCC